MRERRAGRRKSALDTLLGFRHIATRYDKLAQQFASFVALAASVIWLT